MDKLEHSLHAGAVTYGVGLDPFTIHWKAAIALQSNVEQQLFPWRASVIQNAIRTMSRTWESTYGNYNDPAVQQRVKEAARTLLKRAADGRKKNGIHG